MFRSCVPWFCVWFLFTLVTAPPAVGGPLTTLEAIPISEDYVLRTWEMDDGLPNNNVPGIAQTPDGYLWFATWGGLVRFDGVRCTVFTKDSSPGLETNHVRTVYADRTGDLWVGLEFGGVARKRGNGFEVITPVLPNTAPVAWISSFAQDAEGAVWFGHASIGRVIRWQSGRIAEFTGREGVGPGGETFVAADAEGKVWFSTKQACGLFDGTRFKSVDPEGGERPVLAASRAGGMWATRNKQLLRYRADGTRDTVADMPWLGQVAGVTVLFEDGQGDLWIGTRSAGLFRFRNGDFARVPVSHTEIAAMAEDREGNLWVGTMGGGLNRLRPSRFHLRQTKHGLKHDSIASLCEDSEGKLWVMGRGEGPVRSLDSNRQSFAALEGWPGGVVMTSCPDPAGGVWMGTTHTGLIRWKDGVFSHVPLAEKVTALLVDRQGALWAATTDWGPLLRRQGEHGRYLPVDDKLVSVRALAEDRAGHVWAGTEAGLVFRREEDGRFVRVPLPGASSGEAIRFIVGDENDTVWIGSVLGGLYRWRAGTVARLSRDAGLPVDDLRSLAIDPSGDLWIGTARGLFRVGRREVEASLANGQRLAGLVAYGREDGLANVEFSLGFRNATTRTSDGHLWFATVRGALEITPQEPRMPVAPPSVLIESFQAGGASISMDGLAHPTLPPRSGPIQIQYTLPQLSASEQLRFRYRLVGLGAGGWVSAGNQRTATFTYLPPGNYRFEVSAEADGTSLPATALLGFTVSAAWWETEWFRFGLVLLGALGLTGAVRFIVKRRMRERMRKLEDAHALERERTRIARDIHDELGASLTQITVMGELARLDPPEATHGHINAIVSIARGTVVALDEIVWAVNPRYDTLSALIEYLGKFAVEFLSAAGIACEVEIAPNLPERVLAANVRHHLFVVAKETLNNVVKHAGASSVRMTVEVIARGLRVVIADDGRGFVAGSEPADANGLRNLRERMAEAGGEYRIESRVGEGTCVTMELPFT